LTQEPLFQKQYFRDPLSGDRSVSDPAHEPLVRANVLAALPIFVAARGLAYAELLAEVGFNVDTVADPKALVALNRVGQLFDNVASRLGDPAFGIHYAEAYPIGAAGLLGHLVVTAPTVRSSLAAAAEFLEVQTTPVVATFDESAGGIGTLRWKFASGFSAPRVQFTQFTSGCLLLRLRRATGSAWEPLAVCFDHGEPEALREYRRFFGSRVRFDQPMCGMRLDPTSLGMPMPRYLDGVFDSMRELGHHVLKDLKKQAAFGGTGRATVREKVAAEIERRLEGENRQFDLNMIAQWLTVPPRRLQWLLEQEGTSYERILVAVREVLAERYLRDSDLALTHISAKLGFSEASAFTRWTQRSFGRSPSAHRRLLRSRRALQGAAKVERGPESGD
jgi:AraC-like DNA-binding protein